MKNILKEINNAVRFLLEIVSILSIGYWGFNLKNIGNLKFAVGIIAPLIVVLIWFRWGAPMSEFHLNGIPKLILEVPIFAIATLCLYFSGRHSLSLVFAVVIIVNTFLIYIL